MPIFLWLVNYFNNFFRLHSSLVEFIYNKLLFVANKNYKKKNNIFYKYDNISYWNEYSDLYCYDFILIHSPESEESLSGHKCGVLKRNTWLFNPKHKTSAVNTEQVFHIWMVSKVHLTRPISMTCITAV